MTGDERRTAIVRAAIDEFSERGYQGATVAAIAARAGCSEPMLYKHVPDKRALLVAALDHTEAAIGDVVAEQLEGDDPVSSWRRLLRSPEYVELLRVRMVCSTVPDDAELVERLRRSTELFIERFRAFVERGWRDGFIPHRFDIEQVAWTWIGVCLAAVYGQRIEGEERLQSVLDMAHRYISETIGISLEPTG